MKHLVNFSSGLGSWAVAKRAVAKYGAENVVLLFANVNGEDVDNYRFLTEAAANAGAELVQLGNAGRSIWDVFNDTSFIGGNRGCNAANELKHGALDAWRGEHYSPDTAMIHVGFDWSEPERLPRLQRALAPWRVEALMMEAPYLSKADVVAWARSEGLEPPAMYRRGYSHANCGEYGCIQGGHGYWEHRLKADREAFLLSETMENDFRVMLWAKRTAAFLNRWADLGWDRLDVLEACAVAGVEPGEIDAGILRDRSGGETRTLPLRVFRKRIEVGMAPTLDLFANDDCGGTCMYPDLERVA